MRISSFAIHEVLSNGLLAEDQGPADVDFPWSPALVDSDPNLPVQAFTTEPVTVITPNLRQPTSVNLAMRVEFDEGDFGNQYNIGVMLTNAKGQKSHCGYWIFSQATTVLDAAELPQDYSFRLAYCEFSFTFIEEGPFLLSLELREEDARQERASSYEEWISQFDQVLASIPLIVYTG